MLLSLEDLRRLALEAVHTYRPPLEVLAAVAVAGGSTYAEVLFTCGGDAQEDCLVSIGVNRQASETSVKRLLADKIRAHLTGRGRPDRIA
jgi:hypothetical protein